MKFPLLWMSLWGLLGTSFSLQAQEDAKPNPWQALKVSLSLTHQGSPGFIQSTQFGHPAISWMRKGRDGNIHEIELSQVSIGRFRFEDPASPNAQQNQSASLAIRYQFNWLPFKNLGNWNPYLGISMGGTFWANSRDPINTNEFRARSYTYLMDLSAGPGVIAYLSDRWFLDLGIPIRLASVVGGRSEIDDPGIPLQQQRTRFSEFQSDPLNVLQFRAGIGVRF